MPWHEIQIEIIWCTHDSGAYLALPLLFPDVAELGYNRREMRRRLLEQLADAVKELPACEVYRRLPPEMSAVGILTHTVQPFQPQTAWRTPVEMKFHYVWWAHGDWATVTYVPALDIEVVGRGPHVSEEQIREEIDFALRRNKANTSLQRLVWLQRCTDVRASTARLEVEVRSPKQQAQQEERGTPKSILREVASDLRRTEYPRVFERDRLADQTADWLVGPKPRSVLLVGPSGSGKTAIVHALVQQDRRLGFANTPIWSTSGARLVAGMCGFGMWQERCQSLCEEVSKQKALLHLGNLAELMQVGRSEFDDQGVADFLRPYIERGDVLAVAESTIEQLSWIEREAPSLLHAFATVEVPQPSEAASRRILRKSIDSLTPRPRATVGDDAIHMTERLHRRYATYSAHPGRPLRFLRHLVKDAPADTELAPADVTRAFSDETGLPHFLLEDSEPFDLEETHRWLEKHVMGQPQAIGVVVDLLAAVKAVMTRPEKPIASLLFTGPTGVGKTEMAKALAEFLYRDRQRMIRFDMSEYAHPFSIERLIGGGVDSEGLLTSRVREQPFGVVLLDEFEKAHPRFYDLLLQVLGEGRLTDGAGRLADFRNSVVIMTSNLGSESFGRPRPGFAAEGNPAQAAHEHFERAVQEFLRPEMFNRIDRIVPFLPLAEDTLHRIAKRELGFLRERDGIRYRDVDLQLTSGLVHEIARLGYEPRYGARPIKRAIDRHLLAPLSAELNRHSADIPVTARIRTDTQGMRASVKSVDPSERDARTAKRRTTLAAADMAIELRRDTARLNRCQAVVSLRNGVYRMERQEERQRRKYLKKAGRGGPAFSPDPEMLTRLARYQTLIERVDRLIGSTVQVEETLLTDYYGGQDIDLAAAGKQTATDRQEFDSLCIDLYRLNFDRADELTIVVFGLEAPAVFSLAKSYYDFAAERDFKCRLFRITDFDKIVRISEDRFPLIETAFSDRESEDEAEKSRKPSRYLAEIEPDPESFFGDHKADLVGIALELRGPLAAPLLETETGIHIFKRTKTPRRCLVDTTGLRLREYELPENTKPDAKSDSSLVRRTYDAQKQTIVDSIANRRPFWNGKRLGEHIATLIEQYFRWRVRRYIFED